MAIMPRPEIAVNALGPLHRVADELQVVRAPEHAAGGVTDPTYRR